MDEKGYVMFLQPAAGVGIGPGLSFRAGDLEKNITSAKMGVRRREMAHGGAARGGRRPRRREGCWT